MRSLLQTGARVQGLLLARGFRFCFIGGVANFRWGTPRLTNDLDLTVLTGFGGEGLVIAALLEDFEPRLPDAAEFALQHRGLRRSPAGLGGHRRGAHPPEGGTGVATALG